MRALLAGASGFVGSHLEARLAQSPNVSLRLASREPRNRPGWTHFDAADPATYAAALDDVDVLVWLVHGMADDKRYAEREALQARAVASAAKIAGVERIVYLGGMKPAGRLSRHFLSRLATGEALRDSGLPVTELRASIVLGPGSEGWTIMRDLAARLPAMIVPRWLEHRTTPIDILDVVEALAAAIEGRVEPGLWDVPGPETLTYREMLLRVARAMGREPKMLRRTVAHADLVVVVARARHARPRAGRARARRGPALRHRAERARRLGRPGRTTRAAR